MHDARNESKITTMEVASPSWRFKVSRLINALFDQILDYLLRQTDPNIRATISGNSTWLYYKEWCQVWIENIQYTDTEMSPRNL